MGSHKCLGDIIDECFSLSFPQVYIISNCTLRLGRGCRSLELLSKSIQGQVVRDLAARQQFVGTSTFAKCIFRFFHMYFSGFVACISDSLWGQALL